jgi:superfamily II DNA or RNA helicase
MNLRDEKQEEAFAESIRYDRCGLELSMRFGKTRVALKNLEYHYKANPYIRVLVVAPKLPIFQAWKDELVKMDLKHLAPHIEYVTYRSLVKLDPDSYDIVYLDEFHSLLESHEVFLKAFRGLILGLTGTKPKYHDSEKGKMMNSYCPVVYSYTTNDAVDDKVLNNYRIFIHMLDLDRSANIRVTTKTSTWMTSELKSYLSMCKRVDEATTEKQQNMARILRMKAMQTFATKEKYTEILLGYIKSKVLIFANTKEQADKLCNFSYHSDNKNSERNLEMFQNDIISRLSCVNQISEGVTIYGLKACIVLHSFGNNHSLAQRISRCLGLDPSEIADIHILCYRDTIDEQSVLKALEGFDLSKAQYFNSERLMPRNNLALVA